MPAINAAPSPSFYRRAYGVFIFNISSRSYVFWAVITPDARCYRISRYRVCSATCLYRGLQADLPMGYTVTLRLDFKLHTSYRTRVDDVRADNLEAKSIHGELRRAPVQSFIKMSFADLKYWRLTSYEISRSSFFFFYNTLSETTWHIKRQKRDEWKRNKVKKKAFLIRENIGIIKICPSSFAVRFNLRAGGKASRY